MTTADSIEQTRVFSLLRELLGQHDIAQAFVVGDYAAHKAGLPGHEPRLVPAAGTPGMVPSGIQVAIVGTLRPRAAAALGVEASDLVGEAVYVRAITPERWASGDDDFLRGIAGLPTIDLAIKMV